MITILENKKNNDVVFSTELNAIRFTPNVSGKIDFSLAYRTNQASGQVYAVTLVAESGSPVYMSNLGDIFRDFIMNLDNPLPVANAEIKVAKEGATVISINIVVIPHYGNKSLKADDYIFKNFMNDCKVSVLPADQKGCAKIHVYEYFKSGANNAKWIRLTGGQKRKDEAWSDWTMNSLNSLSSQYLLFAFRRKLTEVAKGNYFKINNSEITGGYKVNDLHFLITENMCGAGFIFRNSFGLAEYVFIPGIISHNPNIEFTEVEVDGELKQIEKESENEFSIKVSEAPYWLADNARALANSEVILMLEDPVNFDIESEVLAKGNILVTEISGSFSESPDTLSDFTIKFKSIDI